MFYRIVIVYIFALMFFYPCVSFSEEISRSVYYNHHLVILDMPQELQDFFEEADACEGWVSFFDTHLDKMTDAIIDKSIKEYCLHIEVRLATMKNKYKSNKNYSDRLTVYDDTVIIYDDFKKRHGDIK